MGRFSRAPRLGTGDAMNIATVLSHATFLSFCALIWTAFSRTEPLLRQTTKENIANSIRTAQLTDLGSELPRIFVSLFDAAFTDRLLSWRGFFRSSVASLCVVSGLLLFWYA